MTSSAMQSLDQISETFSLLDDWEDKYRYIIDLGKTVADMPDADKTAANLVPGCVSKVWMIPGNDNGIFRLVADSDGQIVKGLIAILFAVYEGKPVDTIREIPIEGIFADLGLEQNLMPSRRNGFFEMVKRIRAFS